MKAKKLTKETIRDLGIPTQHSLPAFEIGDAILVGQKVVEGEKERIQYIEGDVIARNNNGICSTFTIRRIGANGISVERVFPLYSPVIDSIEIKHKGDVRRAKLYYMRYRIGKAARVKEMVLSKKNDKKQSVE